ncbi:MAG: DUF2232 domain-containing protein [Bacillota bacterium]
MMGSHPSRAVSEGILWALAAAAITLSAAYLPLLASLIWAIPVVVVVVRHNILTGLWTMLVAWLLLMVFTGPLVAAVLVFQFGCLGLVYGYFFKRGASAGRTLHAGLLVAVVFAALVLLLPDSFLGVNFSGLSHQFDLEPTIQFYRQVGLIGTNTGMTEEVARQMLLNMNHWLQILLPGSQIVGNMLMAVLNFIAARWLLRKVGLTVEPLPSFRKWQLPWYYVWGFILGLGLTLLGDYLKWGTGKNTGLNIIYIYLPVLIVDGMAVAAFYWKKLPGLLMLRIVIILTSFFYFPFLVIGLLLLGLFDPLFDYRKIRGKGVEEK